MKRLLVSISLVFITFYGSAEVNVDLSSVVSFNHQNGNLEYGILKSKVCFCSSFSENVKLHSSVLIRFSPTISAIDNVSQSLMDILYTEKQTFDIYEGYLRVDNIFVDNLSLTIGKQRIFWGKGDKINPTDVLDSFDLYGILEFSEKMPSWSLNAKLFLPILDESYIQFVWKSFFESARLSTLIAERYSQEIVRRVLSQGKMFARVVSVGEVFGDLEKVKENITNSSIGLKFSGRFSGFDFSVSFVDRVNDMPFVKNVSVSNTVRMIPMVETNLYIEDIRYVFGYHREIMVGFDVSRDFDLVLVKGEVGVFIPQEVYRRYDTITTLIVYTPSVTNTNLLYMESSEEYLKDPYVKYVIGLERSFGEWFVNFQYAHGLGIERGFNEEKLQGYLILNVERKFLSDTLKVRVVGMVNFDDLFGRLTDLNGLIDNSGLLGLFEVGYYPVMGVKLFLNVSGIDGNGESMLSRFRDFDMVSVGFSLEI